MTNRFYSKCCIAIFILFFLVLPASAVYLQVGNGTTLQASRSGSIVYGNDGADNFLYNLTHIYSDNSSGQLRVVFDCSNYHKALNTNCTLYKNSLPWSVPYDVNNVTNFVTHTVTQYLNNTKLNTSDVISMYGNDAGSTYAQIYFDNVSAPVITSPANNSAQTSRILNVSYTYTGTGSVLGEFSTVSDFSTKICSQLSSNGWSNCTVPTGLIYVRLQGNDAANNSETNWTQNQYVIYDSMDVIGGVGYNWSANGNLNNVTWNRGRNELLYGLYYTGNEPGYYDRWNITYTSGTHYWNTTDNGKFYQSSLDNNASNIYPNETLNFTNTDILVKFNSSDGNGAGGALRTILLMSRFTNNSEVLLWKSYAYQFRNQTSPDHTLAVVQNGASTTLNSSTIGVMLKNTDYVMNFQTYGSTIRGREWILGDLIPDWKLISTNSSLSYGSVGLRTQWGNVYLDDYWVRYNQDDGTLITQGNYTISRILPVNNAALNYRFIGNSTDGLNIYLNASHDGVYWTDEKFVISNPLNNTFYKFDENLQRRYLNLRFEINGTNISSSIINQFEIYTTAYHNISFFVYDSSYDNTKNLSALVRFDENKTNMPILVYVHGLGKNAGFMDNGSLDWAFNSSYNNYFVLAPELRGNGNSMAGEGTNGSLDYGGMEVADIYDAVEYVKTHYSAYIDPNTVFINGQSNGGADTYLAVARFPNYFRAVSPYFGITNYSQWWNESGSLMESLNSSYSCIPSNCTLKYDAHSILSPRHNAFNNINIPLIAFVGTEDLIVPPHHTLDIDNATNYPNQTFYQWDNITHNSLQEPTRSIVDVFFYAHYNTSSTNYINVNMTILGHINYSGIDIRLYNSSGSYTDKISYVTLTTDILSGYKYDLVYENNYSIIDTQTAINNQVRFNVTVTGNFIVEPHAIGSFNRTPGYSVNRTPNFEVDNSTLEGGMVRDPSVFLDNSTGIFHMVYWDGFRNLWYVNSTNGYNWGNITLRTKIISGNSLDITDPDIRGGQRPWLLKNGSEWYLFYEVMDNMSFNIGMVHAPQPWLLNNSSITTIVNISESWEDWRIAVPSVGYDETDSLWKMVYSAGIFYASGPGFSISEPRSIGLAYAQNLTDVNWTKYPANPILEPTYYNGSWSAHAIMALRFGLNNNSIWKDGNVNLFYHAAGYADNRSRIGFTTTTDLLNINLSISDLIVDLQDEQPEGETNCGKYGNCTWGSDHLYTVAPIWNNDTWSIWFNGANHSQSGVIEEILRADLQDNILNYNTSRYLRTKGEYVDVNKYQQLEIKASNEPNKTQFLYLQEPQSTSGTLGSTYSLNASMRYTGKGISGIVIQDRYSNPNGINGTLLWRNFTTAYALISFNRSNISFEISNTSETNSSLLLESYLSDTVYNFEIERITLNNTQFRVYDSDYTLLAIENSTITLPSKIWLSAFAEGTGNGENYLIINSMSETPSLPIISSTTPETPLTANSPQTFIINFTRQITNISFNVNGTIEQWNNNSNSGSYTNSTAGSGTYNVTATGCNAQGCASFPWLWTVDATAPASITNATATSNYTHVLMNWSNPLDADFSHTYWTNNGTWATNLTNQSWNITGSPGQTLNYSAQTVDTAGNVNATKVWFNATILDALPTLYIPPAPTSLSSIQGNFWINYTWQAGAGNVTDSYNVSVNGTWTNGSLVNFSNGTVAPHGWRNISVWAFNSSGTGSLNLTAASSNTQVANNVPVLASIGAKSIEEDTLLSFTISATDADIDTMFYAQNGSGSINSGTGDYTWTPPTPGTYYVNFTANDSYGGLDFEVVEITVSSATVVDTNTTPALSSVTNQTAQARYAIVTYTVNQSNAITRVRYGTTQAMTSSIANQTTGTNRQDNLTPLLNNTLYYYTVDAWNSTNTSYYTNSTIQSFTTAEDYVAPSSSGTPVITGYTNAYSGGDLYSDIPTGTSNTYTVSSYTGNITDFVWTLDGAIVGTTTSAYTTSLNHRLSGGNLRYIRVYGNGTNGTSNTIEWRMSVMKALAVAPLVPLNDSAYDASKAAMANFSLEDSMSAIMGQYTGVMSNYVYLFIWGIIFVMIWIRQGSITMPSTIGLILGSIIIGMLPEDFQFIAQFMIAMGGFALIYVMFSERR